MIKYYFNYIKKRLNFHHPGMFNFKTYPALMQVETTNHCNMKCIMCPRKYMTRGLQHIDMELFEKIIKQLKGYTKLLLLHGFGDPLLCPDIKQIIKLCKKYKVKSGLSTNPVSLGPDNRRMILDSGLNEMVLSLDAADAKTYEKVRGINVFDQSVANIKLFLKEKKNLKLKYPRIIISLIDMGFNRKEIKQAAGLWRKSGADSVLIREYTTWDGSHKEINDLLDNNESGKRGCRLSQPCLEPWDKMAVLSNGLVVPCCVDVEAKYILGDLNTQTLNEVWNSEAMNKLRNQHRTNNFKPGHLCQQCTRSSRQKLRRFYPVDIPFVQLKLFLKAKIKRILFFLQDN